MQINRPAACSLVTVLALGVSSSSAFAAMPGSYTKKPNPLSISLTILGLPTAAVGKVVISGPGSFRRVVRGNGLRTLTGLNPGSYRLVVKPVKTSFGTARAKQRVRQVTVTSNRGARLKIMYTTPNSS